MVKYVQGTGNPWGTMQNVQDMVNASPRTLSLVKYPSTDRYEGYRYVNEQTEDVAAFFQEYLADARPSGVVSRSGLAPHTSTAETVVE